MNPEDDEAVIRALVEHGERPDHPEALDAVFLARARKILGTPPEAERALA